MPIANVELNANAILVIAVKEREVAQLDVNAVTIANAIRAIVAHHVEAEHEGRANAYFRATDIASIFLDGRSQRNVSSVHYSLDWHSERLLELDTIWD